MTLRRFIIAFLVLGIIMEVLIMIGVLFLYSIG